MTAPPSNQSDTASTAERTEAAPGGRPRAARWLGRVARGAAIAYLLALLAVVAALRLIGERWWVTTIALYLPRIGFALPLPFIVAALLAARAPGAWLLTQLAAAAVVVGPLMGLHLGGPRAPTPGAPAFRIFTANIGLGYYGLDEVLERIHTTAPDVVVLEETEDDNVDTLRAGLAGYVFWNQEQFTIASRFPIENASVERGDFATCRLMTPGGPVRLFAVHPVSPHSAFDRLRGEGLRGEIVTGRILKSRGKAKTESNATFRLDQIEAFADAAAAAREPVLIAGDTNLPDLSWALAHWLGGYRDAFAEAGRGFGYTYPAQRVVWMRIDRVLVGPGLRVLAAATAPPRVSQHLPLVVDLEVLPGAR
ncbi:MAG TPA: endonuclease/exonuclease/phosphatase family protein [Polyangia bacterium]|nr:endonuclease/exonuclease/phosphatase family protein [Polyangia bacterium]